MKLFKGLISTVLLVFLLMAVAGCSGGKVTGENEGNQDGESIKGEYVTILTGGSSGVYFPLGGVLAQLYQEKLGVVATSQSTAASAENATKLNQKKAEVGFLMGDTALDAYEGIDSFEENGAQENLRSIAALYPNYLQIATTKKSNISTIEDLKGKRLAVGAPGSGTEISARRVLEAYDMSYDDLKVDYLSFAEGIDGIKNGSVDAVVISSGLPNSGLLELATSEEVVILEIKEENIKKMSEKYPSFFSTKVPANIYAGQDKEINTVAVYNVLLTHKEVDDHVVYLLTKTMFENIDVLQNAHNAAKEIDVNIAQENLPAPLHPGAEKYYKELENK